MSIATEITRLQTAKSNLKTSIENKGVTVPSATLIDGYASLVDQISGGGGSGREYEMGTYTPAEDLTTFKIYFTNTHNHLPLFFNIIDISDSAPSTNSAVCLSWEYWDNVLRYYIVNSSNRRYGLLRWAYRGTSSSVSTGGGNLIAPESNSDTSTNAYPRYWADESWIRPFVGANYYYRSGRTYKWIAIW